MGRSYRGRYEEDSNEFVEWHLRRGSIKLKLAVVPSERKGDPEKQLRAQLARLQENTLEIEIEIEDVSRRLDAIFSEEQDALADQKAFEDSIRAKFGALQCYCPFHGEDNSHEGKYFPSAMVLLRAVLKRDPNGIQFRDLKQGQHRRYVGERLYPPAVISGLAVCEDCKESMLERLNGQLGGDRYLYSPEQTANYMAIARSEYVLGQADFLRRRKNQLELDLARNASEIAAIEDKIRRSSVVINTAKDIFDI